MPPQPAPASTSSPTEPVQRSPWITFPLTILLFMGSGIAGTLLAEALAPDSILAGFLGLFTLPLAFLLGMYLWLGLAILAAIGRLFRWLLGRRRGLQSDRSVLPSQIPPGSFAFVPASVVLSGFSGFFIALVSTTLGFLATLGLYVGVGLVYGLACWLLARTGYLPHLEEA
jgi:hypothetical protein